MAEIPDIQFPSLGSIPDILEELLEPVKEALYDETIKGLTRYGKVILADTFSFRNMLAGFLNNMAYPRPDPEYGVSPNGMVDAVFTTLYATAITSALLGEEVGEELWMEMIQEGISNAFQTSLGGSLQTSMNIYRGGLPLSVDDLSDMPWYWHLIDEPLLGLIMASAGANLYATLHYTMRGIMNYLNQQYMNIVNQIQVLGTRLIEDYLWHINLEVEMKRDILTSYIRSATTFFDYIVGYANDIIETATARINDYINELDTNYDAYQSGDLNNQLMMGIIESIQNSFNKLKEEIENVLNNLHELANNIDASIPQDVIDDYKACLQKLSNIYAEIVNAINTHYDIEMQKQLSRMMTGLTYLWAYRSYDPRRQQLPENWQLPLDIETIQTHRLGITVKGRPQQ